MHPNIAMHFFSPLLRSLWHLGYFAPFVMGILDSSFLFLPFGNDLVIIALVSQHHREMPLYVVSAACGSTVGVFLLAVVAHKLGEEGIHKISGSNRFRKMQRAVSNRGGLGIVLASLAPPPFPFTMVIATAAAFNYPRARLLGFNFLGRAIRFTVLGFLAIRFGQDVLRIENARSFRWSMAIFTALCLVGSGFSVWSWLRNTRSGTGRYRR
jgi:membrane protein YqaA with SNARE-associated domain